MRKHPDKAKEEGTGLFWLAHTSGFQSIPAGKLRQQELKAPRRVTVKSRGNDCTVPTAQRACSFHPSAVQDPRQLGEMAPPTGSGSSHSNECNQDRPH